MVKYRLSRNARIRIAKIGIGITIWEIVILGALLGSLVPGLGGHGSPSFLISLSFMLIGAVLGFLFSRISSIASKHFESRKTAPILYIYAWCVCMIYLGRFWGSIVSDIDTNIAVYILSISLGIIGLSVLIIKISLSFTDNSEHNNEEKV